MNYYHKAFHLVCCSSSYRSASVLDFSEPYQIKIWRTFKSWSMRSSIEMNWINFAPILMLGSKTSNQRSHKLNQLRIMLLLVGRNWFQTATAFPVIDLLICLLLTLVRTYSMVSCRVLSWHKCKPAYAIFWEVESISDVSFKV